VWFEPIPDDRQLDLDLARDQVAIWGAVGAGITIGEVPEEPGKVHVHRRHPGAEHKDIDASYDIIWLHHRDRHLVVEGTAALAFSISELAGRTVQALACPHCSGLHIDEFMFATFGHRKHLCNSCGRNFIDSSGPSISNPLADAHAQLDLSEPAAPVRPDRPLAITSTDFSGVRVWPSNCAIVSTMDRPEEIGFHVHAWDHAGNQVLDDTFSSLTIDSTPVDEGDLRALTVQRALVGTHSTPIQSLPCSHCGHSLTSPTGGWIEPTTTHVCGACGETTKTRRKVFLNPLADKGWSS
jgi:hypothetical protein